MNGTRTNHTGKLYGHLTVLRYDGTAGEGKAVKALWRARCVCGKEITVRAEEFTRKLRPKSHCGCKRTYAGREVTKPSAHPFGTTPWVRDMVKPTPVVRAKAASPEMAHSEKTKQREFALVLRRSGASWPDVAELTGMTVEEAKKLVKTEQV